MASHLDEADQLREREIRYLRWQVRLLLGLVALGALTAILGGPAAVAALQAAQTFAGVVP